MQRNLNSFRFAFAWVWSNDLERERTGIFLFLIKRSSSIQPSASKRRFSSSSSLWLMSLQSCRWGHSVDWFQLRLKTQLSAFEAFEGSKPSGSLKQTISEARSFTCQIYQLLNIPCLPSSITQSAPRWTIKKPCTIHHFDFSILIKFSVISHALREI